MRVPLYDVAAVVGFLLLLVGVIVLAGLERPVPAYLSDALKIAIGAVFTSGAHAANDYLHRGSAS